MPLQPISFTRPVLPVDPITQALTAGLTSLASEAISTPFEEARAAKASALQLQNEQSMASFNAFLAPQIAANTAYQEGMTRVRLLPIQTAASIRQAKQTGDLVPFDPATQDLYRHANLPMPAVTPDPDQPGQMLIDAKSRASVAAGEQPAKSFQVEPFQLLGRIQRMLGVSPTAQVTTATGGTTYSKVPGSTDVAVPNQPITQQDVKEMQEQLPALTTQLSALLTDQRMRDQLQIQRQDRIVGLVQNVSPEDVMRWSSFGYLDPQTKRVQALTLDEITALANQRAGVLAARETDPQARALLQGMADTSALLRAHLVKLPILDTKSFTSELDKIVSINPNSPQANSLSGYAYLLSALQGPDGQRGLLRRITDPRTGATAPITDKSAMFNAIVTNRPLSEALLIARQYGGMAGYVASLNHDGYAVGADALGYVQQIWHARGVPDWDASAYGLQAVNPAELPPLKPGQAQARQTPNTSGSGQAPQVPGAAPTPGSGTAPHWSPELGESQTYGDRGNSGAAGAAPPPSGGRGAEASSPTFLAPATYKGPYGAAYNGFYQRLLTDSSQYSTYRQRVDQNIGQTPAQAARFMTAMGVPATDPDYRALTLGSPAAQRSALSRIRQDIMASLDHAMDEVRAR